MGGWISEQRRERQELDEGAGPAMGQDQWDPAPASCPLMDEVDVDAIDLGAELRKLVELRLLCSPVKGVLPVVHQVLEVLSVRAVVPACSFHRSWPASACQAVAQVVKGALSNVDREGLDAYIRPPLPLFFNTSVLVSCSIAGRAVAIGAK